MIMRLFFITVLSITLLHSQGTSTGAGSLQLPFLADGAALAESHAAGRVGIGSMNVNPALLWGSSSAEVRFTHSQWMADVRSQVLAAIIPSSDVVVGIALTNTSIPDVQIRETPGAAIGSFAAHAFSARLTGALAISEELALGVTGKYLFEKIYVDQSTGFALDAGITYHSADLPVDVGAALTNIGSMNAFRSEDVQIPMALKIGIAREIDLLGINANVFAAYSNELRISVSHVHAGIELDYSHALFLRAGYVSGYESRSVSAGLGVTYGFLRIDYSYIPFSYLQDSHCISVGVLF
jgi:hypothetical protein